MDFVALVPLASIVGAVIGAIITGFVTRRRDVADSAIQALTILVEKQEAQITRLDGRLEKLEERFVAEESRHKTTQKKKRMVEERYSTSLGFIGALWSAARLMSGLLDAHKIEHVELIPIPNVIKVDLHQQYPEYVEDAL